jgi:hypothetical protein
MRHFFQAKIQLPPCQIDSLNSHDQLISQSELISRSVPLERMGVTIVSVSVRRQSTHRHHPIDRNLDRTHNESILFNPPNNSSEHLADPLL